MIDNSFLAVYAVAAVIFGIVSAVIWRARGGQPMAGFLIGLVFGILGLLWAIFGNTGAYPKRECPWCRSSIRSDALVCPRCQREIGPTYAWAPPPEPPPM